MASTNEAQGDVDNDIAETLPSRYESCEAIIRCVPGLRFPENDDFVDWERGDIVCCKFLDTSDLVTMWY